MEYGYGALLHHFEEEKRSMRVIHGILDGMGEMKEEVVEEITWYMESSGHVCFC